MAVTLVGVTSIHLFDLHYLTLNHTHIRQVLSPGISSITKCLEPVLKIKKELFILDVLATEKMPEISLLFFTNNQKGLGVCYRFDRRVLIQSIQLRLKMCLPSCEGPGIPLFLSSDVNLLLIHRSVSTLMACKTHFLSSHARQLKGICEVLEMAHHKCKDWSSNPGNTNKC